MNNATQENETITQQQKMETIIKTARVAIKLDIDAKKFMPDIIWVLKARSDDKTRGVLSYLNVDDNGFCCSDGRRLHLCQDKKRLHNSVTNGIWEVIISKDLIVFNPKEGQFPDYSRIIPEYVGIKGIIIDLDIHDKKYTSEKLSSSLCRIHKIQDSYVCINIDYLKDMIGYCWTVQAKNKKAIKLVSGKCIGLIMPLSIK